MPCQSISARGRLAGPSAQRADGPDTRGQRSSQHPLLPHEPSGCTARRHRAAAIGAPAPLAQQHHPPRRRSLSPHQITSALAQLMAQHGPDWASAVSDMSLPADCAPS